jgi:hypothetical protein
MSLHSHVIDVLNAAIYVPAGTTLALIIETAIWGGKIELDMIHAGAP